MEKAPQIDHDGLRTFPTKHVAQLDISCEFNRSNVICIVLNKRYFAFTFPIDFTMVMSPQAASGLDGVSASRHKNEAQTQHGLHLPCLLGVPMGGEINLVRSG